MHKLKEKEDRLKTQKKAKYNNCKKGTMYKCQNETEMTVKMANKLTY